MTDTRSMCSMAWMARPSLNKNSAKVRDYSVWVGNDGKIGRNGNIKVRLPYFRGRNGRLTDTKNGVKGI